MSRVFLGGAEGRILSASAAGKPALVLSPIILEECRPAESELGRHHAHVSGTFEPLLALSSMHAMIVDAPPLVDRVSEDADDDMVLPAAVASESRLIVSGDRRRSLI